MHRISKPSPSLECDFRTVCRTDSTVTGSLTENTQQGSPDDGSKGFTLSMAKQVLSGHMDTVIKTIEDNARLV